jgi:hypothetical protein
MEKLMLIRSCVWTCVLSLLLVGAAVLQATAQVTTGTVSGTVKDTQGGVIPGATVLLISETQGTKSTPVVTSEIGAFVFANVRADTYTIEVTMPSFKTLNRTGVSVSPGSRVAVGDLTIAVGGATEVVNVTGEAPPIQSTTGERSFTVATDAVSNLPLATRSFAALVDLTPGVDGGNRIGDTSSTGGGSNNFMMDGVSTMEPGSNRLMMAVNVESVAEVKVLTSNYQAEYGRSSGLQVAAVTKSGTNRFRGSMYDVERNSNWNANSKVRKLNGDPKPTTRERDWGYSIGGPVGKPGGHNKLFFFYAQEFEPRSAGNDVVRYRMPTALERQGDFSQSTDNTGNPFPYIKDFTTGLACSTTATGDHSGCFQDGGVLGRIPANRVYQIGLNILNMYPLPNLTGIPATQVYNFELTRPTQTITAWQPAIRIDYQPLQALRATFKLSAWGQPRDVVIGSLPGFNDTIMNHPSLPLWAASINYTVNSTTFVEATVGHAQHHQAGCALTGGGSNFCTNGFPVNPVSSRKNTGLANLPFLFPDANIIDQSYYQVEALNAVDSAPWDGTRFLLPPSFSWGGRVANNANTPPNNTYPGFADHTNVYDFAVSLTKVMGRHTVKMGFYEQHALKQQNRGAPFGTLNFANDGNNPLDSQYGYANAALGIFASYAQASKFIEGTWIYNNTEGYIQDNWKVTRRLTFDYGLRLVHQQPQYDITGQSTNFLADKWSISSAPVLYTAGCANGVYPCSGNNRQALNPATNQFLGANSTLAIGALVPASGSTTNGLFLSGKGIATTTYTWPIIGLAPRFGAAWDPTGRQRVVLRGGAGLFFDRPSGNSVFDTILNPPTLQQITVRYGQLQALGSAGLSTTTPPALNVFEYDAALPSSVHWNGGVQMALPWAVTLDVSYVGQHGFNIVQPVNLNAVDYGSSFLAKNQDLTLTASATPGATAVSQDLMRAVRAYSSITQNLGYQWRTYHSIQLSFQRRFRNGLSFGFNDTMGVSDKQNLAPRLQHAADGTFSVRSDQADAEALLGNNNPRAHIMKANFVWDLPDLKSQQPVLQAVGLVINDWQLSGIWTASTGSAYTVSQNYQSGGGSINLTGSPDYGARIRIVGDPGQGCSTDIYRQFTTAAFQGPPVGSVGLDSGNGYLRGCFSSILDLAIARNIRLGHGRNIQLRVDMFNAPNQARVTGRNTTLQLANPNDPITNVAPVFDPVTGLLNNGVNLTSTGTLSPNRSLPKNAGFGVANNYQNARSIQGQIRFSF